MHQDVGVGTSIFPTQTDLQLKVQKMLCVFHTCVKDIDIVVLAEKQHDKLKMEVSGNLGENRKTPTIRLYLFNDN